MYRHVSIQNFRAFGRLDLDSLSQINLISGPNDVGKTAVLEALFLHASGPIAGATALSILRPTRGLPNVTVGQEQEGGPWDWLFRREAPTGPIVVEATTSSGRYALRLSLDPETLPADVGRTTSTPAGADFWSRRLLIEEKRGNRKPVLYRHTLTLRSTASPGPLAVNTIAVSADLQPPTNKPYAKAAYYSTRSRPTAQTLAAGYSGLRQRLLTKPIIDALRGIDPRVASVEVLVSEGQPTLWATLEDGTLVPFYAMGEGISSVTGYLLSSVEVAGGLVLVDEIENGVHHSALRHLWRSLYTQSIEAKVQFVVTTHSYECLLAAYQELADEKAALSLYRLTRSRSADGSVTAVAYNQERLRAGLEMELDLR